MSDVRATSREVDLTRMFPWMRLLRTFLVALDPFKLIVAAAGILLTALGWWLISLIVLNSWTVPKEADYVVSPSKATQDRTREQLQTEKDREFKLDDDRYKMIRILADQGGTYRTWPWMEDRGPNPYFLAKSVVGGTPGERRDLIEWFYSHQAPNLIEPLRKFLSPIIFLFDARSDFWVRVYLMALVVWMMICWAFFGGVLTRMSILQLAGRDGGGLRDAMRFVGKRYISYLISPIVPLGFIALVVVGCMFFGFIHMIPAIGEFVDGILWFIPLGAGFVIALLLVGLVGYPLMYSTLSAEGSDTFDAISRSYNYVYESPWSYAWYWFISMLYGAVVIFFVVFMSSAMVYLGKWAIGTTPWIQSANASPEYLFLKAPTSFGWKQVLLEGTDSAIDKNGAYLYPEKAAVYLSEDNFASYKWMGASMVSFWLTLFFLMMLGFAYSYFWTQASMIYLLMRKKVDETEIDEVYLEETAPEVPVSAAPAPLPRLASSPAAAPATIDLGTARVPAPAPTPVEPPKPAPVEPTPAPVEQPKPEGEQPGS